ncbi:hypothetical protein DSM104443_00789 [Usitatibacter rugosus]|uniref:Bacterial Ig-like domain-containing protein n=1 Tax=Usitatibacter rugosus TaxID=2732067 RepID=A0A6M4GQW7_9PROT|nr:Ig-like domain-containing protein [Usitatibacter rugosus]QJR09739.1 hypothetical protein DSM104443_00789 [Usitatibacter rugosus]
MFYIRRFRAALAALAFLCVAFGAQAQLWFGDERGLHRFDPNTGVVDVDLPFGEALSLVTDRGDGSVWVLSKTRLARFSSDGSTVVFNRTLASFPGNLGTARKMAVNPADATAWIAGERRVLHVNGGGGELLSVVPGEATDLAVAQDGTLWVLDEENDELRRYTSGGALLHRVNLGGASRRARHLAIDSLRGFAWFVADRALVKRSFKTPGHVLARINVAHDADAICSDVDTGDLWVLGGNVLYGYGSDGTSTVTYDLRQNGIANAKSLSCDFATRSLWVGHRRGFSQFTRGPSHMLTQRARDSDWVAVAREATQIRLELEFLAGSSGPFDDQPLFRFRPWASCGGGDCGFEPWVLESTLTFAATLDGTEVGTQFFFDSAATGEVIYMPAAVLADGTHTLTVQAVDGSGNRSEPQTFTFDIDTTPPALVSITPADGAHFPLGTTQILVDFTFDASATNVGVNGFPAQFGNHFRAFIPVPNRQRVLTLTLHATDPSGNLATVPITYTIEQPNVRPVVQLVQPTQGQVFDAPANVTVEATATDSDGTIDRVMFTLGDFGSIIVTSPPYRAVFTGVPIGQYALSAVAFDNRGDVGFSSTTVTVQGPPSVTITTPAPGAAVFEGTPIVATFQPAPNRTLQSLTVLRDGQVLFTVPNPGTTRSNILSGAGVHTYAFVATDSTGAQGTAEITLTVKPFDLVVETPVANAEVTTGEIRVSGHYFGPSDTAIRVNGIPAFVTPTSPDGGTFTRPITLGTGPRVIEVELTSPSLSIGRVYLIPVTVLPIVIVPPPDPPPVGGGAG